MSPRFRAWTAGACFMIDDPRGQAGPHDGVEAEQRHAGGRFDEMPHGDGEIAKR